MCLALCGIVYCMLCCTGADSSSDDLTVQVIFFGEGDKTGNVVLNVEASGEQAPKAKL